MRIIFCNDALGISKWKVVEPRTILSHSPISFGITSAEYEGKTIKYGFGYIENCLFDYDGGGAQDKSWLVNYRDYEDYSSWMQRYARNGLLSFQTYASFNGIDCYAGVRYISYGNINIHGNEFYSYGTDFTVAHIALAQVQINSEDYIAFYFKLGNASPGQVVIRAVVISINAFDGAEQPRYTPPTSPDLDGGYGTGETPDGNQTGGTIIIGGFSGGGDHISVYPPNVDVNVEVNMPEPEKIERAQPSNINIAVINDTSLNALIAALWGKTPDGFANLWKQYENYKFNPMAGVVKCMRLPRWVTTGVDKAQGDSDIGIAGTTIVGFKGKRIGNPIVPKIYSIATASEDEGIPFTRFNDFKDFVGVSVQAYAPFVGWFDLDPSMCFGGGIDFKYTCDASNGNITVEIWGTSVGQNDTQKHYQLLASGGGNCAYDIIISGNDNGMGDKVNGFTQIASGVGLGAVGLVTENVPMATSGVLGIYSGGSRIGNAQQQTVMVGNISGSTGYLGYLIPFVRVIKPRYVLPDSYEAVYGRPVSGGSVVSDFEGCYAELDVHCSSFGFANAQEQRKIIDMLARGVHV